MRALLLGLITGLATAALIVLARAGRTSAGIDAHLNGGKPEGWWL